jgi:hypothetical protein
MTIHPSQIILIIGLLFFIFYLFKLRKLIFDRIFFLIVAIVGLILVLFPQLSAIVANWLGIVRGSDLVFYTFIIFSLFYFVSLNAEIRMLRKQITELARSQALANPVKGKKPKKNLVTKL